jgi:phosphatidylinositol alpha 1,6-mannosyltransferase
MGGAAMRALETLGVPIVVLDPTPLHPRVGTVLASSSAGARVLRTAGISAQVWRPGVRTDEHHPGLRSTDLHDRWARAEVNAAAGLEPLTVVGYAGPVGAATTKIARRLTRIAALPGVRLVVLGCGPGTAALKQAGAKIVGDASGLELARGIASFDVLVHPRKADTAFGAARKALASGVPVVAFDTGAARELIAAGENGVLVSAAKGAGEMSRTVASLVADPDKLARLAGNARASVADRTWSDAVSELVSIYQPLHVAV